MQIRILMNLPIFKNEVAIPKAVPKYSFWTTNEIVGQDIPLKIIYATPKMNVG